MFTKREIGSKIKELRLQKGLSQEQLGKVLHKSHVAISDIERGKTDLRVTDLLTIANHLNESVALFLNIQTNSQNYSFQLNSKNVTETDSKDLKINIQHNTSL